VNVGCGRHARAAYCPTLGAAGPYTPEFDAKLLGFGRFGEWPSFAQRAKGRASVGPLRAARSEAAPARPLARCGQNLTPLAAEQAEPRRSSTEGNSHPRAARTGAPIRAPVPARSGPSAARPVAATGDYNRCVSRQGGLWHGIGRCSCCGTGVPNSRFMAPPFIDRIASNLKLYRIPLSPPCRWPRLQWRNPTTCQTTPPCPEPLQEYLHLRDKNVENVGGRERRRQ
jgi:hypothetical protein